MTGRIPQTFIDDLLTRVDIVEIIGGRVPLKKTGANYSACCPFHQEKTPSFSVNQRKQFYYCFGCGAHGNAIGFLIAYEHLAFPAAVEKLAHHLGMTLPEESAPPRPPGESERFRLMEQANAWFKAQLRSHPEKVKAVDYLKSRGVTGQIALQFSLGFAPSGWEGLYQAMQHQGFTEEQLLEVGLVVRNENHKTYDRFRDRLMFSIRNKKGQVIGFGGRVFDDSKPKYLNSPETSLFHKGKCLYGLYEALTANAKSDTIVVVEGYMDVVALSQMGFPSVVATLGTAVTESHCRLLFREAHRIIFCFDGDVAGTKAAWRALESCLPIMEEGYQVQFLFLPEGDDPDSFVRREGLSAWNALLSQALTLSQYFIQQLKEDADCRSVDGRSAFIAKAKPYLSKLPNNVFGHLLIASCAEVARMDADTLKAYLQGKKAIQPVVLKNTQPFKNVTQPPFPMNGRTIRKPKRMLQLTVSERLMSLLLQEPALLQKLVRVTELTTTQLSNGELLVKLINAIQAHHTTAGILERFRDDVDGAVLAALAAREWELSEDAIFLEAQDCVDKLLEQDNERIKSVLISKVSSEGLNALTDEERDLFAKFFGQRTTEKS